MDQAESLRQLISDREKRTETSGKAPVRVRVGGELGRGEWLGKLQSLMHCRGDLIHFEKVNPDPLLQRASSGPELPLIWLHQPNLESSGQAAVRIKTLRLNAGTRRFYVIVNSVTDGRMGVESFRKLQAALLKTSDVKLEYLGHTPYPNEKSLIHWKSEATEQECLELLAKRLKETVCAGSDGKFKD